MKVNELRIENLIRWISTGEIDTVKDIFSAGRKHESINNVNIQDCEPIPLTEEWLKRFGVTKDIDVWELTGVFWLQELEGGCFFLGCNSGWTGIEIKYVHQLQNLYFALTGDELKISKI